MLTPILSNTIHVSESHGHTGYFHFPYGDYKDPGKGPLGALEALNDFFVQSLSGFDTHWHEEQEIISYCVEGELSHHDSLGNAEILRRGDVGYQCAGSGLSHTEQNPSPIHPLRFVQILFKPNAANLPPSYQARRFSERERRNKWLQVASGNLGQANIQIHQDANIFAAEIDAGARLAFILSPGRQAYLVCLEGNAAVNHYPLAKKGAIKATHEEQIHLTARKHAHLLLIEIAAST